MSQLENACVSLAILFALTACSEPQLNLKIYPATFDCEALSCQVVFVVESRTKKELSVIYKATLYENQAVNSVGAASGEIALLPSERKTISRTIVVSEVPNGSQVRVTLANP